MAVSRNGERVNRLAFLHYLRTGQRLTSQEWLARYEQKFNPYHDERGRFTSPPGVIVSWGRYGRASKPQDRELRRPKTARTAKAPANSAGSMADGSSNRASSNASKLTSFRSEFVRNATVVADHAETYFELNKRQAGLNRLRKAAGLNPASPVKADLDEIQKRLDADRARLDARQAAIDSQTNEILRAGLAPVDVATGAINIATGAGKVRDYLSVAGAVPIGAAIRRIGGVIQIGGAQSVVRRLIKLEGVRGVEVHHVPSRDSLKLAGIAIPPSKASVIAHLVEDHRITKSWVLREKVSTSVKRLPNSSPVAMLMRH